MITVYFDFLPLLLLSVLFSCLRFQELVCIVMLGCIIKGERFGCGCSRVSYRQDICPVAEATASSHWRKHMMGMLFTLFFHNFHLLYTAAVFLSSYKNYWQFDW